METKHYIGSYTPDSSYRDIFYICGTSYKQLYDNLVEGIKTEFLDVVTEENCKEFFDGHGLNNHIIGKVLSLYPFRPFDPIAFNDSDM